MAENPCVPLGRLRWPVLLATRAQEAQLLGRGTGITEKLTDFKVMRADVQPVGALTFWGAAGGVSEQVDSPITHRIFMRWVDSVPNTSVVLRQTRRSDNTMRTEIFRVRRFREVAGRKRFVILEVEEERNT